MASCRYVSPHYLPTLGEMRCLLRLFRSRTELRAEPQHLVNENGVIAHRRRL